MRVEINPEPAPEEREALLKAVAELHRAAKGGSAWWEAGIREAVEDEPEGAPVSHH